MEARDKLVQFQPTRANSNLLLPFTLTHSLLTAALPVANLGIFGINFIIVTWREEGKGWTHKPPHHLALSWAYDCPMCCAVYARFPTSETCTTRTRHLVCVAWAEHVRTHTAAPAPDLKYSKRTWSRSSAQQQVSPLPRPASIIRTPLHHYAGIGMSMQMYIVP